MNKIALVGTLLLCTVLTGCSKPATNKIHIVTKEAKTMLEHYEKYTDGTYIYVYNCNTKDSGVLSVLDGTCTECMHIKKKEPETAFKYINSTKVIDPTSLDLSIEPTIPFTYNSNFEKSMIYLATMEADKWTLAAYYSNSYYIDCYLVKSGEFSRIIVFKDSLKVFPNLKENLPDPWTYINEG